MLRAAALVMAFLASGLAGCAGLPGGSGAGVGNPTGPGDPGDPGVRPTDTKGILVGVVVDDAIRPVADATVAVALPAGGSVEDVTDAEGRFAFGDLEPGTYFVQVAHLLYAPAQTTADVVAGEEEPPLVRVLLQRLFSQEAFSEAIKFEGFIQCGYVLVVLSSLCLNDYTTIVIAGGVAPWLRETLDRRGYVAAIGGGWQTIVYEMVWEPSTGTSSNMFMLTSFYNRTASDSYGSEGGTSPVLMREEAGDQGDDGIPLEGMPDMYTYGAIDAAAAGVGFGFNQRFTIFQHTFYHGSPPEDWSFVAGDEAPF